MSGGARSACSAWPRTRAIGVRRSWATASSALCMPVTTRSIRPSIAFETRPSSLSTSPSSPTGTRASSWPVPRDVAQRVEQFAHRAEGLPGQRAAADQTDHHDDGQQRAEERADDSQEALPLERRATDLKNGAVRRAAPSRPPAVPVRRGPARCATPRRRPAVPVHTSPSWPACWSAGPRRWPRRAARTPGLRCPRPVRRRPHG